jgi:hypothetical protein
MNRHCLRRLAAEMDPAISSRFSSCLIHPLETTANAEGPRVASHGLRSLNRLKPSSL